MSQINWSDPITGRMLKEDSTIINIAAIIESALASAQESANKGFGKLGWLAITGTNAVTPASGFKFYGLIAMEDTVVAAATIIEGSNVGDLTAFTNIADGQFIPGSWSSITLTSGKMIGLYAAV